MKGLRNAFAAAILVACRASPPPPVPSPATVAPAADLGFDSSRLAAVAAYVASQVDSAYPDAVIAVGRHGRLALLAAAGHYGADDPRPVDPATIYDLASLTKVIGLTTACMMLVDEGKLDLDAPVQAYVPEFRGPGKEHVTIRHLLTHSSGLPAWRPTFREARDRRTVLALIDTTPLDTLPGARFVYSDLGAIVLMQVVERISGERIDRYLARRVFEPLGMTSTRYLPPGNWRDRIAPTEIDTAFRHRLIRGEVHDENAGRMGGVSGHAGLFSDAPDLARFAAWLLEARRREQRAQSSTRTASNAPPALCSVLCLSKDIVLEFTRRQGIPPGSTRALGWDTPSDSGYSSAGTRLSRQSFGHTGFTGTSIWMDPDRDLFVILLTNRVNPTRANTRILRVRATVADLVASALTDSGEGDDSCAQASPVFEFRSSFWLNLHNFLVKEAKRRLGINDDGLGARGNIAEDTAGLRALTDAERAAWSGALDVYAERELRNRLTDSVVSRVNNVLTAARDSDDLSDVRLDSVLQRALRVAAPVYRAVWWPRHDARNRAWIAAEGSLVAHAGRCLAAREAALFHAPWQAAPIRVDATVYASWFGAYTTLAPTHITISSTAIGAQGADGLELLLHEAGHSLLAPLDSALAATAIREGKALPPELSHLMLFYTTGPLAQDAVAGHEPWADHYGVWDRNPAARHYRALLQRAWGPYIDGTRSFVQAVGDVLAAL